jgi:hypothetical protein
MKSTLLRLVSWLVVLRCCLVAGSAAQFVIIARSGANSWAFYDAETLKINNKDRLRIGSAQKLNLSPDEYKHLTAEPLLKTPILRRHAGGYLVRKEASGWAPVAPDGLNNGSGSYADLWKLAQIVYQADRTSKTPNQLRSDEVVFAILPGTDRDRAVTEFLADETNFSGVGEADSSAAFTERMSLLVYAAQKLTPPAEGLQQILLSKMTDDRARLNSGLAHKSDLVDGLAYAKVSRQAFPNESRQKQCRDDLDATQAWLNKRLAILRALAAGGYWDDFLAKYDQFDRWRNSFPDIGQLKDKAFKESALLHEDLGAHYESGKQWARALAEYKLAQRYKPNDRALQDLIDNAKNMDDHDAQKPLPPNPDSPAQTMISRRLYSAKTDIADTKLDDAEQDIKDAEKQDPTSIRVLLAKADLLRARKSYQEARLLLDDYDRKASGVADVNAGIELRNQLEREYTKRVGDLKAAIVKGKEDGDYLGFAHAAREGAQLDPHDADFLHNAAFGSALIRNRADAVKYQKAYISQLTLTPGATDPEVNSAYEELAILSAPNPEPQGTPNWFSGYKSAPGVFYCPISFMPGVRIRDIKSGRQTTSFQWRNDQLEVDKTGSEPSDPDKDVRLLFEYRKGQNAIWRAATADNKPDPKEAPAHFLFTPNGTNPAPPTNAPPIQSNWTYFTILNHPDVDPLIVERLMHKQIAILVSPNLYFHPFEWNGVYRFAAVYDDQGRVKSANLISDDPAAAAKFKYEFSWNGPYLQKISGDEYQRVMKYEGGRLISESVTSRGKTTEIRYNWLNGRLVSAKSGEDAGGKSRDVTFQ